MRKAKHILKFTTIDGETEEYAWEDVPSVDLQLVKQPLGTNGVNFKYKGESVFIPWRQIKKAMYKEVVLIPSADERGEIGPSHVGEAGAIRNLIQSGGRKNSTSVF